MPPRKKARPRSRFSDEYGLLLERIVAARKAAELHQEELAQKLDKVQSHVSLIETREREIGVIDLFRWCRATGVRFSDLAREFEEDVERMEREGKSPQ